MKHGELRTSGLLLAAAGLALALAGCGDLSLVAALKGDSPGQLRFSPSSALVPENTDFAFTVTGGFSPYEVGMGAGLAAREDATWVFPGRDIPGQSQLFTIQATDLLGNTASAQVTVYAVPAPLVLDVTAVTLVVGGSWTFHASGGSGPYSWSVNEVPVSPPPVPDTAYTYLAAAAGVHALAVTDSIGLSQSATVTVREAAPGAPLEITPLSATVAPKGTATFLALGGTGEYTFEVVAGGAGGTIASAGANPATYQAPAYSGSDTVRVSDGGSSVTAAVLVIDPAAPPLSLSPQSPTVAAVGDRIQFQASGGTGPGTYTFSTNKPAIASIDPLTGSYLQLREGHAVVAVRDAAGASAHTLVQFVR